MTKIIGLSGSLRKQSFNTGLLRAALELMPAGAMLELRTVHGIPLYDGDVEAESGIPEAVSKLKNEIADADGLLIATPEYNNSIPGVLKNAIDWLSRPPKDISRVFGGKHVAVMGATPGGFGTILAQNEWLPTLRHLGMQPYFGGRLLVSHAHTLTDANGVLSDPNTRQQLADFVAGFVKHINNSRLEMSKS